MTVNGRMYREISALEPANGIMPLFASIYVHDTEHGTSNRKHFFGGLREILLFELAAMLAENSNLVKSFISLRNII